MNIHSSRTSPLQKNNFRRIREPFVDYEMPLDNNLSGNQMEFIGYKQTFDANQYLNSSRKSPLQKNNSRRIREPFVDNEMPLAYNLSGNQREFIAYEQTSDANQDLNSSILDLNQLSLALNEIRDKVEYLSSNMKKVKNK